MVTGRVVDYDPADRTYQLPPEHAAVDHARGGSAEPGGLRRRSRRSWRKVEDGIIDAFQHGGGVPYADFPQFQRLMAQAERPGLRRDAVERDARARAGPDRTPDERASTWPTSPAAPATPST